MVNILDEAKIGLQRDFGLPTLEWDYLASLIAKSPEDRHSLLKWVFEESPAFWDTRAKAGMILLQEDEIKTWQTIKHLVESNDPDDNGTALTIFQLTGDPQGIDLAQSWLSIKTHPATQIEAVNFLKSIIPNKVSAYLQDLKMDEDPQLQNLAKQLTEMFKAA